MFSTIAIRARVDLLNKCHRVFSLYVETYVLTFINNLWTCWGTPLLPLFSILMDWQWAMLFGSHLKTHYVIRVKIIMLHVGEVRVDIRKVTMSWYRINGMMSLKGNMYESLAWLLMWVFHIAFERFFKQVTFAVNKEVPRIKDSDATRELASMRLWMGWRWMLLWRMVRHA